MRVSPTDVKILKELLKKPEGMYVTEIAKALNKHIAQISLRLQILELHNIVECVRSGIAVYRIRKTVAETTFQLSIVECPKCGTQTSIAFDQIIVVCRNRECRTKSGNPYRFWKNRKRIVGQGDIRP